MDGTVERNVCEVVNRNSLGFSRFRREREREKVIWRYDRMLGIIFPVLCCVFAAAIRGTSALFCSERVKICTLRVKVARGFFFFSNK